jgi:hypothetical protein
MLRGLYRGFEVYTEKGCGFLEAVYQECLEIESGFKASLSRLKPSWA